jgi:hypothetical protein
MNSLRECEARTLLRWPLAKRQAFLVDAEKKRGAPAIQALKDEMRKQFKPGEGR